MAEASQSKTRNEAFLRQLEKQRLNKPCNRIIDLRGKVAGECQAYSFGNLTHYLDDRAYLLAKQLLNRFNGNYTIGVYEALFKALKSLSTTIDQTSAKQEATPILFLDKTRVQTIKFDQLLQRKEPRIFFATPVELRIADMLYHATTIDITSSAIRIALKRAYTLDEGNIVTVSFPELISESQPSPLAKINYTLLKIEHDSLRTYAILVRDRNDNQQVTEWLDNWSQQHNTLEHLDLDNELLNLAGKYYLRLYTATLNSPLLWLSNKSAEDPVKAFKLTPSAKHTLTAFLSNQHEIDFSSLPIQLILEQTQDYLVIIDQENKANNFFIARSDNKNMALALIWHAQHPSSHVFLIKADHVDLNLEELKQEISLLAENSPQNMNQLISQLAEVSTLISLTDITASCQHLAIKNHNDFSPIIQNAAHWSGTVPRPTPMSQYIKRQSQRFLIRTNVALQLQDKNFSITTLDVSATGLSFSLPGHVDVQAGKQITINFVRWQNQTKEHKLNAIPFTIKNITFWQDATILGLERNISACSESINRFFISAIERNKEQLVENNRDIILSHESKILGSQIAQTMTTIPLYFCMDNDNKRILQAIATTHLSHENQTELWQALQNKVTFIYEQLKSAEDNIDNVIRFGLYCYFTSSSGWQISTEYNFTTPAQKSLFINRALVCEQYYFFHCVLTPITSSALVEQQGDLNQQLLQLRSHSPHKVKQIRTVLHSLFAIGELTDITDILKAVYLD